jgi:hypothetical protein
MPSRVAHEGKLAAVLQPIPERLQFRAFGVSGLREEPDELDLEQLSLTLDDSQRRCLARFTHCAEEARNSRPIERARARGSPAHALPIFIMVSRLTDHFPVERYKCVPHDRQMCTAPRPRQNDRYIFPDLHLKHASAPLPRSASG